MIDSTIAAPGTIAYEALAFLRDNIRATTPILAFGIGRNPKRLIEQLQGAVDANILTYKRNGNVFIWGLGPNADVSQSVSPGEDVQQVTRVSAMAAPSIFAYADQRGAAAFSCSLSTDGRLTTERRGRVIAEYTDAERRMLLRAAAGSVE